MSVIYKACETGYEKEKALVLELCRFLDCRKERLEGLLDDALDFPWVLGQLLYNRMGGVAFFVLREQGLLGRVNREFRNALQTAYAAGRGKTEDFLAGLDELSRIFAGADFRYAFLKGAYLASRYPAGLRTSNDFDVLVEPKDVTRAADRLKAAGFRQGHIRSGVFVPADRREIVASRMNRGETVPFLRETGRPHMPFAEVDINFSLDFQPRQESDALPLFLRRAEPSVVTPSGRLFTLADGDFLLHLCAHLYKEATVYDWVRMGRDLSLYKFCDIYLFLREMTEEQADRLAEAAAVFGLEKECAYSFAYTRRLFDIRSGAVDRLIDAVCPADRSFMNRIVYPSEGKVFAYAMDPVDWLFCGDRRNRLREIGEDRESKESKESGETGKAPENKGKETTIWN